MKTFQEMNLPEALIHTLRCMQFEKPTPIQLKAIPIALEGKDILGSAQTGTGKTGAFGVPLVAHLLSNPRSTALVMTPTRELATQVIQQLRMMLGKKLKSRTALLIGGESISKQLRQLRSVPRVVVGTPGRVNDHLERGSLSLSQTDFLVLDETDRMLDMGFTVQIERVMKYLPEKYQTLLFSATLPKNIVHIAKKYLSDPVRIAVNQTSIAAKNIKQDLLRVRDTDKYSSLLTQLSEREGSIIVFVKTKYGADKMAARLVKEGHDADAIHGDLRQNKRDRVMNAFRKKKCRILVATDVAARGLDVPHIEHVINYDLPQCAEDYIHRIGRTARAGAPGAALNLITPSDKRKWDAIVQFMNPDHHKNSKKDTSHNRKRRFKRKNDKNDVVPFKRKNKKGGGSKQAA